jgi:hypothetical protein
MCCNHLKRIYEHDNIIIKKLKRTGIRNPAKKIISLGWFMIGFCLENIIK